MTKAKRKVCAVCEAMSDWLIMARLKFFGETNINIELHWVCPPCLVDRLKQAKILES